MSGANKKIIGLHSLDLKKLQLNIQQRVSIYGSRNYLRVRRESKKKKIPDLIEQIKITLQTQKHFHYCFHCSIIHKKGLHEPN